MTCSVGGPFVAGLYAQNQKLWSVADNIANVLTDGFKKTRVTVGQDVNGNPAPVVARINSERSASTPDSCARRSARENSCRAGLKQRLRRANDQQILTRGHFRVCLRPDRQVA